MGNVVGSNIANVLLVLGIPALIAGINTSECKTVKNYVFMMLATLVFLSLAFLGSFSVSEGIIFLILLTLFLSVAVRDSLRERQSIYLEVENVDPNRTVKIMLFLSLGLIGLPIGADILVKCLIDSHILWYI